MYIRKKKNVPVAEWLSPLNLGLKRTITNPANPIGSFVGDLQAGKVGLSLISVD